jgi:hypothetical protein
MPGYNRWMVHEIGLSRMPMRNLRFTGGDNRT